MGVPYWDLSPNVLFPKSLSNPYPKPDFAIGNLFIFIFIFIFIVEQQNNRILLGKELHKSCQDLRNGS
ncbi:hypothetical protein C1645_815057 [Glomus cerebriforme]|uniref:Uncharacterized protein n=1 Tax=Glomus cerebriforme TaxID=658196 RepID=A0A397TFF1_9GLOM|nr:hypothetical protein C1645_815057 [Glomus cerebriforme]